MVVKELSELASLYRQAAAYPSISSGNIVFEEDDNILTVHSKWSQRDVDRSEKVTTVRSHVIDLKSERVLSQSGPIEVRKEVWNKKSPQGNFRAIVRSAKDKKNDDKQYLEVYDKTKKVKSIDVLALDKHGKIIANDGQFGSFQWSSSEGHILYVAEKKKPKAKGWFDIKDEEKENGSEDLIGRENDIQENWGETLVEVCETVLCILDIETAVVSVLDNVDDSLSPGQAIWAPDNEGVVFCAWEQERNRLGLRHCCQRMGGLYYLDLQKSSVERLFEEGRTPRFPRFSPDMSKLVYIDSPTGGPHYRCAQLVMLDWASKKEKIVVEVVKSAPATSFQGIFTAGMSRDIWFEDGVHIAFSTAWRSNTVVVIVNTETGAVKRLSRGDESLIVLQVHKSSILMSCSSFCTPPYLSIAQLSDLENPDSVKWINPDGIPDKLDLFSWQMLYHTPSVDRPAASNGFVDYESILCLPPAEKDGSLPPLIVFSHGGPHGAFDTGFKSDINFFCLCGYAVLMINYRGSWGFGQDGIESLPGAIGDLDVKDVESAMLTAIAKGKVDGNRVVAFGGSHGGFLTTHLIGQYPKTFKAASTRNPVTNLVSMASTTDIKDWVFIEAGLPFNMAALADDKILPTLWQCSPISHIDQVITPTLLMVGLEDKRVPSHQAIEYYKQLKARNVPTRCLTYPKSNHSLAEVDVESDSLINTIRWFNSYI